MLMTNDGHAATLKNPQTLPPINYFEHYNLII
jgi:hypothetical protein